MSWRWGGVAVCAQACGSIWRWGRNLPYRVQIGVVFLPVSFSREGSGVSRSGETVASLLADDVDNVGGCVSAAQSSDTPVSFSRVCEEVARSGVSGGLLAPVAVGGDGCCALRWC